MTSESRLVHFPALIYFFLVRIQTADPSAFEMPDTPADEAGFFIFQSGHSQLRPAITNSATFFDYSYRVREAVRI